MWVDDTGLPNILLIHCHDLRQYVSCYGVEIKTPNVDHLANGGDGPVRPDDYDRMFEGLE